MREIKFRAWNKLQNIMCYDNEDNTADYWDGVNSSDLDIINQAFKSDIYVYMQYTGMNDKNGKRIFEGDIIKSTRGYSAVVEWVDDGRFLGFTVERERKIMYVGQEPAVEIIGNIYENPELLKEPINEPT